MLLAEWSTEEKNKKRKQKKSKQAVSLKNNNLSTSPEHNKPFNRIGTWTSVRRKPTAAISVTSICFWQFNRSDRSWIYFSLGCEFLILTLIQKVNVSYQKFGVEKKILSKNCTFIPPSRRGKVLVQLKSRCNFHPEYSGTRTFSPLTSWDSFLGQFQN